MEKMKTVDAGYVQCIATMRGAFNDCFKADITLVDLSSLYDLYDLNNERCYLVKKSDLDTYMARKEDLEKMNCTPVYGENQRLTAKVKALEAENAYLTRINEDFFKERSKLVEENEALKERNTKLKCMVDKFYGMTSAGEELRAANEKLKAEVADLNERINHLEVVLDFLDNKHAGLIIENNKLRGTNNELNAVIVQLRDNAQKAGYL